MSEQKLTLRDYLSNESMWGSPDEPLRDVHFVDLYRSEEGKVQPLYSTFTSIGTLRRIKGKLDDRIQEGLDVLLQYFKGYPSPVIGNMDLGKNGYLDHPQATSDQIKAVEDLTGTKEWKDIMEEWHEMIDGE
ncbi:MAG: hypothetical protein CMH63_02505 [Nanoarchaeota archaeon]|jgi:hypothetical protein|nr:hypothetical protein [Nanoarchaeota archaeon]|tara:strand:+ start:4052 stop:4447 length:396 start_codon:yes stop_codon:yes gene_type:complete